MGFHAGELAVQTAAGQRAMADEVSAMIATRIPVGGRPFLAQQPVLVTAAADADGRMWAGLLAADQPGFARASGDGRTVHVDLAGVRRTPEPVVFRAPMPLGLLAIELATRRRLRINGTVVAADAAGLALEVAEAFPNCPKHITRRPAPDVAPGDRAPAETSALTPAQRERLAHVDTAFVASRHPRGHLDASHRGGPPGFIVAPDAATLEIPDYQGNSLFQTLGNLAVDPAVGLALLDVAGPAPRLLQITGRATIAIAPTARTWRVAIKRVLESPLGVR